MLSQGIESTTSTTEAAIAAAPGSAEPSGAGPSAGPDPVSAAPAPDPERPGQRIWPYVLGLGISGLLGLGAVLLALPALRKPGHPDFAWFPRGKTRQPAAGPPRFQDVVLKKGKESSAAGPIPIPYPNTAGTSGKDPAPEPGEPLPEPPPNPPDPPLNVMGGMPSSPDPEPANPKPKGQDLLAHEITHVGQPGGGANELRLGDTGGGEEASEPAGTKYPENMKHETRGHVSADSVPPSDLTGPSSEPSEAQYRETDLDFVSRGAESQGRIPAHAPEWTDHHAIDPGVVDGDTSPQAGEKGGTEDLNIGVGELQKSGNPDDLGRVKPKFSLEHPDDSAASSTQGLDSPPDEPDAPNKTDHEPNTMTMDDDPTTDP